MTIPIFPAIDGLGWDNLKRADFKTAIFESLSGRESRVAFRQYPKVTFKLSLIELIENRDEKNLTELLGFMQQMQGMYGNFLYKDPNDSVAFRQNCLAIGNTNTVFQLTRAYGGFVEPVENIDGIPEIYLDGYLLNPETDFTLSESGLVNFTRDSEWERVVTWTGGYFYRCRFTADGYDFTQLMSNFHECSDIEFIGSLRNIL